MSTQIQTVCDICSKIKGDANHWWKIAVRSSAQGLPTMIVMAPSEEFSGVADICSHNCATQALARFLDHGTLESIAYSAIPKEEPPSPEPPKKTKR